MSKETETFESVTEDARVIARASQEIGISSQEVLDYAATLATHDIENLRAMIRITDADKLRAMIETAKRSGNPSAVMFAKAAYLLRVVADHARAKVGAKPPEQFPDSPDDE